MRVIKDYNIDIIKTGKIATPIKLDLHIHSKASILKDSEVVKESDVEHLDILFDKLEENEIGLFSITDHNKFDAKLYETIDEKIADGEYLSIKNVIAGVEIDACIDNGAESCHLLIYFDAKNDAKNYKKIQDVFNEHSKPNVEDSFSEEEYEAILKEIGLGFILVAEQRCSVDRASQSGKSAAGSTGDFRGLIRAKYFDAIEVQSPRVEGIIKDDLKTILDDQLYLIGSDCHEWKSYPKHDSLATEKEFNPVCAKILPTFKGLLMAVTFPESRLRHYQQSDSCPIKSFSLHDEKYEMSRGITAVIGENGAGKTFLLKVMCGEDTENGIYANLYRESKPKAKVECKPHVIEQGLLVDRIHEGKLFSDALYKDVDHSEFEETYKEFANSLYGYIRTHITEAEAIRKLKTLYIDIAKPTSELYYVSVTNDLKNIVIDDDIEPLRQITQIIGRIRRLTRFKNYNTYDKDLNGAIAILDAVAQKVKKDIRAQIIQKTILGSITKSIDSYNDDIAKFSSESSAKQISATEERSDNIQTLLNACRLSARFWGTNLPKSPHVIKSGCTRSRHNQFDFTCEAYYNNKNLMNEFLMTVFNKEYQEWEKILSIEADTELSNAINKTSRKQEIKTCYLARVDDFMRRYKKVDKYIADATENKIGATFGEMSIAYFKFASGEDDERPIVVDQPEDNISNKNINDKLIGYMNKLRRKRQVVIATHSPLLVVNQDVDNVIFVEKCDDGIKLCTGCLEYECEEYSILDLIAEHMDGGQEAIEKRIRVYGKKYISNAS